MRYASRYQHYLALKKEIFSSTDFHYGTARANAKSVSILNTVRFTLLNFLAEKRRISGRKNGIRLALRDRECDKNCNGKR
jgi:hypothetical protein